VAAVTIEHRVIDDHATWMRKNAVGARDLELPKVMSSGQFFNELLRRQLISDMGAQMAVDAFKRGLAVIALAPPQYRVLVRLTPLHEGVPYIGPEPEWETELPKREFVNEADLIEVRLTAYGFPIASREA
jgi:hypothetical protein